jgi:hypothetical protein
MSPTFLLEYWWMGQKAEEQKVSTVKTSTSIKDMTGKLSEKIDIKMGLAFHLFEWEKLCKPTLFSCGWVVLKTTMLFNCFHERK